MKNFLNAAAYSVLGFSHVGEAFQISPESMAWLVSLAYMIIAITYVLRLLRNDK